MNSKTITSFSAFEEYWNKNKLMFQNLNIIKWVAFKIWRDAINEVLDDDLRREINKMIKGN